MDPKILKWTGISAVVLLVALAVGLVVHTIMLGPAGDPGSMRSPAAATPTSGPTPTVAPTATPAPPVKPGDMRPILEYNLSSSQAALVQFHNGDYTGCEESFVVVEGLIQAMSTTGPMESARQQLLSSDWHGEEACQEEQQGDWSAADDDIRQAGSQMAAVDEVLNWTGN